MSERLMTPANFPSSKTGTFLIFFSPSTQVVGFISDGDIMKFIAKQNPRIIDMTSFITVWYDTESFEKKLYGPDWLMAFAASQTAAANGESTV